MPTAASDDLRRRPLCRAEEGGQRNISPVGVMARNPWGNSDRNSAMRQELARKRKEDEDIALALEADALTCAAS